MTTEYADFRVVGRTENRPIFLNKVIAKLKRVESLEENPIKFGIVRGAVVVVVDTIKQDNIALLGNLVIAVVFDGQVSLFDVHEDDLFDATTIDAVALIAIISDTGNSLFRV